MTEFLRRFLALCLLLCGGALFLWPGDKVLVVRVADFQRSYADYQKWEGDKAFGLEVFKFSSTEGRRQEVSGQAWEKLAKRLENPDGDPDLAARRFGYFRNQFAFAGDEAPFNSLDGYPLSGYICIDEGRHWLFLQNDYPQEFTDLPYPYWRPYRWYGLALAMAGLLVYFLIPKRKWGPEDIRYPQGNSVIAPDLMGLMLTPVMGLLPLLVVWSNSPGTSVFSIDKGWIWLTGAMWLMAACGIALLIVGLRYSQLAYRIGEDGLHEFSWTGSRVFPWGSIDYFQSYESKTSSRLGTLLLFFGGSLSSAGLGMTMRHNNEVGIKLYRENGEVMKIMENSLARFGDIEAALKANGVKRKRKQKQ
ncbi:hypothetical protein GM415_02370 [Pseudodesulfovibrio cashew]|uniref:Uncharacterized protein n=1 Tax=Pseudodesulfovibrio cashew TaxID=2678688 RepID=A0A6I6JG56_9BACT|nr:hypothetical protein [Pseudodesulfovibrio cashew]QGY39027.1 hypothetical protein GM415_02370 [Pseudodesulfovibrio cashew]